MEGQPRHPSRHTQPSFRRNPTAMDTTFSPFLLHSDKTTYDSDVLLEQTTTCSDAGYHSGCNGFSPASSSSVDSCSVSPSSFQWGSGQETTERFVFSNPEIHEKTTGLPVQERRRSRSKYPGKKRQSASEREKMRMRDLTKALNHLRTYLPPSVAPAGQSLTKIETLRLTIRYISHLSAQLGLSQEDETQSPSPDLFQYFMAPRDDLQTSFLQSADTVMSGTSVLSQPGFALSTGIISEQLQSYQSPSDGYSFAHSRCHSSEDTWALQKPDGSAGHWKLTECQGRSYHHC